jgi:hypothetical protein
MAEQKGYKRSWKNLLINKRYQLRFTLFMVALSTLLMTGLGIWIMVVANETTQVAISSQRGRCPKVPTIKAPFRRCEAPKCEWDPPFGSKPGDDQVEQLGMPKVLPLDTKMKIDDEGDKPATEPAKEPAKEKDAPKEAPALDDNGEPRRKPKISVTLDEMELPKPVIVVPPVPKDFGPKVVRSWACEIDSAGQIRRIEAGRTRILLVLIAAGVLLVLGLAVYGIKMTHRVAGPLFKVQLYLAKMREGRFDKVYNLRKGDQLVDFYEHFKTAHAGVVKLEQSDIERLKKIIAAAESAGAGDHASIQELRTMLARKEKSLE